MNKKFWQERLGTEILVVVILALLFSAGLFFLLDYTAESWISNHFSATTSSEDYTRQAIESFQDFVASENLSTKDTSEIQGWVNGERYAVMSIYMDNFLVYSSDAPAMLDLDKYKYKLHDIAPPWRKLYDITFSNGEGKVDLVWIASSWYYDAAGGISVTIALFCFVFIVFTFIRRKTGYIHLLKQELMMMEGGELSHPITVKGRDELASLACSMDEMRLSFIEKQRREDEERSASSQLVTAISHDLRTPLTVLIGYMDVIVNKKYRSEEQLEKYIHSSRNKAYQIKELSDKLFEYFRVFSPNAELLDMEKADCETLLGAMIGEHLLRLSDEGFTVRQEIAFSGYAVNVSRTAMGRVLDNLFQNIVKYADKEKPVWISCQIQEGALSMEFVNAVRKREFSVESTGIGLANCERIISQHGGHFETVRGPASFAAIVKLRAFLKKNV